MRFVPRTRMTTAGALIVAVAVAVAAGVTFAADDDAPLLPAEAAASLGSTDPAAIGADAVSRGDDISIVTVDDAFVSRGASVKTEIPEAADSALSLRTASGRLQLIPQGVSAKATDGQLVSGGEAVIYANTSVDADTAVKPIERGLETFRIGKYTPRSTGRRNTGLFVSEP